MKIKFVSFFICLHDQYPCFLSFNTWLLFIFVYSQYLAFKCESTVLILEAFQFISILFATFVFWMYLLEEAIIIIPLYFCTLQYLSIAYFQTVALPAFPYFLYDLGLSNNP